MGPHRGHIHGSVRYLCCSEGEAEGCKLSEARAPGRRKICSVLPAEQIRGTIIPVDARAGRPSSCRGRSLCLLLWGFREAARERQEVAASLWEYWGTAKTPPKCTLQEDCLGVLTTSPPLSSWGLQGVQSLSCLRPCKPGHFVDTSDRMKNSCEVIIAVQNLAGVHFHIKVSRTALDLQGMSKSQENWM